MGDWGVIITGRVAPGTSGLCSHNYRCTGCGESWDETEFITPDEATARAVAHVCPPKDIIPGTAWGTW